MRSNVLQRAAAGAAALAVICGFVVFSSGVAAAACSATGLVPQVRKSTVNQGLGSYAPLVRGKDTMVRLHLSLPSCSTGTADYIEVKGATVTSTGSSAPLPATAPTPDPANGTAYPRLAPFDQAPSPNTDADVKFRIPGANMDSTGTGQFTVNFQVVVTYLAHANGAATGLQGTITHSLSATVGQASNNLRVLLVPMGDGADLTGQQFPTAATQAVQSGVRTISRVYPVRAGIGDLTAPGNGIRFKINPTMLNLGPTGLNVMTRDADLKNRFCGTDSNFAAVKGGLANVLNAWNAANPTNGADKVIGVVWQDVSKPSPCYQGLANIGGKESWVRVLSDPASGDGTAGGLLAHELMHTLSASVAPGQIGGHSPTQNPDVTGSKVTYNLESSTFILDPRNAARFQSSGWTNGNVLMEKEDWAHVLCRLRSSATTTCTAPGSVGVGTAVSLPGFVLSGRVPVTGAEDDVRSYRDDDARDRSMPDPTSPIHVKQIAAPGQSLVNSAYADVRYSAATITADETEGSTGTTTSSATVLDLIVDLDPNTAIVQVTKDGVSTPLYTATKTGQPVLTSVVHRAESNLTNSAASEGAPAISPDGVSAAWTNGTSVEVRPVAGGSTTVVPNAAAPDLFVDPVSGNLSVVFVRAGDVHVRDLTTGTERRIYARQDQVGFTDASASHPSADPLGTRFVVSVQGRLYVLSPALVGSNPLTCRLDGLPGVGCTQIVSTGDATWPSWSSDGFIAYERADGVHRVNSDGTGQQLVEAGASRPSAGGPTIAYVKTGIVLETAGVTTTGTTNAADTSPALTDEGNVFLFDRTVGAQHDIFTSVFDPANTIVQSTDDNPEDNRLYAFVTTPGTGNTPVLFGAKPTSVSGNSASWDIDIPQSGIQAGSSLYYVVVDGFLQSAQKSDGTTGSAVTPRGVIHVPANGAVGLQYDALSATGLITYPDGRVLADADHLWSVSCAGGFTATGTGRRMPDVQPPVGGFTPGTCTFTLRARTPQGDIVMDTATETLEPDADHDQIAASKDKTCGGATKDNDASNGFADDDGDGIPNKYDGAMCVSANTVTVDFDPNTLNIGSTGVPVTVYVAAPAGRDLRTVSAASVAITDINGYTTSIAAFEWSATRTSAVAKFDRATVNSFFHDHPELIGQKVRIVITGAAPAFSMRGFDPNAPLISN